MNEKKITYIVLGVLVVGLVVMGMSSTTYALFSSDDYGTNTEAYATGLLAVEAKSKSDTISLSNALPISDEEGLESEPYVFTIKNIGNLDYEFDVMLKSTGNASDSFPASVIKLQINNGEVTTLANLTDGKLNTDKITLLAGETIDYSIRIWLSEETSNEYINRSFNSKIVTNGQAIYTSSNNEVPLPSNLLERITFLYMNNKDDVETNNGKQYRYARIYDNDSDLNSSGGLMNDRQGSMLVGEDEGNIRYFGKNPNNYIYFNCDDYSNQSADTCEVWRIIGVFDGKVKIMRNESIGDFAWDNKASGIGSSTNNNGSNEWSDSRLMMLLNPGYDTDVFDSNNNLINEHNRSYYWNSTGTSASPVKCYSGSSNATTNCYFDDKGIKNDTTRGLISESLWYLRGLNSSLVFSDQIYEYERTTGKVVNTTRSTTWTGKIAIPYPSDYGYAADFGSCNVNLNSYNNTLCTGVNWMKSIFTSNTWLLTPYSGNVYNAWYVFSLGKVYYSLNVYTGYGVAPVLYLNSELSTGSGDGSQNTPYQLAVN